MFTICNGTIIDYKRLFDINDAQKFLIIYSRFTLTRFNITNYKKIFSFKKDNINVFKCNIHSLKSCIDKATLQSVSASHPVGHGFASQRPS